MAIALGGCTCPRCTRARAGDSPDAKARAEGLLREHLTPGQLKDWAQNRAFNVRGSQGGLYRLTPGFHGRHSSVVRHSDRLGIAVWPVDLLIEADWALALMLYFKADEETVVYSGCHGPRQELLTGRHNDYNGEI